MTGTLPIVRGDLEAACGSTRWVSLMDQRLPFATDNELHVAVDECFDQLSERDWLEAFAAHPRIGDVADLRARFVASGAMSEHEQSQLADIGDEVLHELASGNERYEQQFGFVFLIRAAGRSAQEILEQQRARIDNDRATELANAAEQQREITHLRIERSLAEHDPLRPKQG